MFIIGCILPSKNLPFDEYKRTVQDVCDVFDELSEVGPVIVCGGFNADIKNKYNSQKSKLLKENIQERNHCSIFADNNFTFQIKDKQFKSLIDYIFVPEWIAPGVKYKEIFQEFSYDVSDHFHLLYEMT